VVGQGQGGAAGDPDRLRLANALHTHITNEVLPPQTHLPRWEELAQHLGIKELVVYNAYQHLADKQLLTIRPDEGVQVASPPTWLPALRDELNRLEDSSTDGLSPGQLAEALRTRIHQGIILPGELLPRMKALALDLNVSKPTVQEACWQLRDEGLLIITKRQGTRVAPREEWKTGGPAAASRAPRTVQTAQPEPQPSPDAAIPGGPQALDARQAPEPGPGPGGEVPGGTRETGRTTGPEGAADAVPPQHK
jgi:DNA-binding FadR family transcriptional regulator